MTHLIVPNFFLFNIKKTQLATLSNVRVLLKGVLIDLHACNFVHAKTSLHARCLHARHCAHNLLSLVRQVAFLNISVELQLMKLPNMAN